MRFKDKNDQRRNEKRWFHFAFNAKELKFLGRISRNNMQNKKMLEIFDPFPEQKNLMFWSHGR